MNLRTKRNFLAIALCGAAVATLTAGSASAAPMTSSIGLSAGANPSFTATMVLGTGSTVAFGSNAVQGTYQAGTIVTHVNFGFSISNQTSTLSANNANISATDSSGSTSLTYDNVTGAASTINSVSANLSGSASTGVTINGTGVTTSVDGINLTLTPSFVGTISDVTFTSTGAATVSGGVALVPGYYSLTVNGSVGASLSLIGNIGTILSVSNAVLTESSYLPVVVATSTSGSTLNVDYNVPLSSAVVPFTFVESLAYSTHYSLGNTSSGISSVTIQNTTMTANLDLTNISYNLEGSVAGAIIPEPSSVLLLGLGVVGIGGVAWKRRKSSR